MHWSISSTGKDHVVETAAERGSLYVQAGKENGPFKTITEHAAELDGEGLYDISLLRT